MITLEDITDLTLEGEGSFDKLMRAMRLHINDAVYNNEITQSEAGAIYTGVIPTIIQESVRFEMQKNQVWYQSEVERIKYDMAVADRDNKLLEYDVNKQVVEDPSYVVGRIRIAKAEADIAEASADKARTESEIVSEQLIAEKEKNGIVGYRYIYKYKYYDYENIKHNINPTFTDGEQDPMPETYSEIVVFAVYKNGENVWVETDTERIKEYSIEVPYYSYKDGDDNKVETNVKVYQQPVVSGQCYIITDATKGTTLVNIENDEPIIATNQYVASSVQELTEGNTTNGDWDDEYNNWIDNPDAAEYVDVVSIEKLIVYIDYNNINKYVDNVLSETGWDGTGDNVNNKPNTSHTMTYPISVDETEVYSSTRVLDGEGGDNYMDSIVTLQKKEIAAGIEREDAKVSLSKLPSTYR